MWGGKVYALFFSSRSFITVQQAKVCPRRQQASLVADRLALCFKTIDSGNTVIVALAEESLSQASVQALSQ